MSSPITIKEIAKLADVSIGTVDRVLHNRGRVAEATKVKVLQIAKEGNYSSNVYARNLKLNKSYKIGAILPEGLSYWRKQWEGMQLGIQEQEAMGFSIREYSLEKGSLSVEVLNRILEDSLDGLVIAPHLLSEDAGVLALLKGSQIPYVFIDVNLENGGNLAFIGQDAFQSGLLAGSLLDRGFDENYELFIVTSHIKDLTNEAIKARIAGLQSYYGQHNYAHVHEVNFERDELNTQQLIDRFYSMNSPIHVFVPSSRSYLIGEELKEVKKQLKLRFLGYDLVDQNVTLMKAGVIDYLIHQKPRSQGYLAIQTLYKHLFMKMEVVEKQYMPIEIVKKENLKYCDY